MKYRIITAFVVLCLIMIIKPQIVVAQTATHVTISSGFTISASLKTAIQGFLSCREAGDSLIAVESKDSEHWGYIDMYGRQVIPCQYLDVGVFSEGLARVARQEDAEQEYINDPRDGRVPYGLSMKYTYINRRGERAFSNVYSACGDFHYGLAYMRDPNGRYGFIDKTGKMAIPCELEAAHDFCDSVALVKYDGKWFFIDLSGKMVVQENFKEGRIYDYHEGIAAAADADKDWDYTKWRYINKRGEDVVPGKWNQVSRFSEGCAVVDYSKVIDKEGNEVFRLKDGEHSASSSNLVESYANSAFSDRLLLVKNDDTKEGGYVDHQGHIVIPFTTKLYHARPFRCGLAFVELYCGEEVGWHYGFVDRHGNYTFSSADLRQHELYIEQQRAWQKQHEGMN